ncbi:FtsW/RodA/SpoVE family cell cycle protein [Loigolactobacillus coryniformis]|uniref:Probable peptidoglycan glycosyltransferase FtsW n=1 Tax=Loigolactobacillus coryniformis TaxID=1610 RepID=A0A5B8TNQ4_9LACO|nr:FtsW/RodA/SpoVE family cell cycle protein [Loigolactobacillus coryniformis]QEA54011.1 FtsW/RodA/SpoVE family cell cycle protein [Loigolactobacillus coryniformis]
MQQKIVGWLRRNLQYRDYLPNLDWFILVPYLLLSGIGIVMVFSASSDYVIMRNASPVSYLIKQAFFVVLGLFIVAAFYVIKLDVLKSMQKILICIVVLIIALLYLLFAGHSVNGASAWINVGFFNIQPVEFAKFILIWYLAYFFSHREHEIAQADLKNLGRNLVRPGIIVGSIMFLVIRQPDIGGTSILAAITLVLVFTSGARFLYGFSFSAIVFALVSAGFMYLQKLPIHASNGYQYRRLMAFVHPFALAGTDGKQLVNSYYAINNGGWFGVGLGNSIQKRGYLPEPYTDFIMSITAEELGLVAVIIILALVYFLAARIILVGIRARDSFSALFCIGIGAMIMVQTTFNIGGISGVLPITGVTFPFVSYGGSSMLVLVMSIGVALNVSATEKGIQKRRKQKMNKG